MVHQIGLMITENDFLIFKGEESTALVTYSAAVRYLIW